MKKQLLRVKQIADQTFLRAEKSEVLTEDLIEAEKRVDILRQSCQAAYKKIGACQIDFAAESSAEKRLKKIPQVALAASLLENGCCFSKDSILGSTLRECASIQSSLGNVLLKYYNEVEKCIVKPLSNVLENEIHSIAKLRKNVGKLTLDMDSARNRFIAAERHSIQTTSGVNINTSTSKGDKVDNLKDELEEASLKVDQCRDALASEMFALLARESHFSEIFLHFHRLQANYHRSSLDALEKTLPVLEKTIADFPQKPIYGCPIEEHLRVTNREIAHVIEFCVHFLLEFGISEEGLLRLAGSASKMKKLKYALNAGFEIDMTEYIRDPHAVSGAFKSYLRDLPEPLLTFSLYDDWIAAARIQDLEQRVEAIRQVLYKLPQVNFVNLQYVMKFLFKLQKKSEVNKMSSQNIAIVMAPNLIWSPVEDVNFGINMSIASLHNTIVDVLISHAESFFQCVELPILPEVAVSFDKIEQSVDFDCDGLLTTNILESSSSPKSVSKVLKKPAAPPPPPKDLLDSERSYNSMFVNSEKESVIYEQSTTSLEKKFLSSKAVSFSDSKDVFSNHISDDKLKLSQLEITSSVPPSPSPRSIRRRKSNESLIDPSSHVTDKSEKPNVPEKPSIPYATYRSRGKCRDIARISECTFTHQRPTVPPPNRPIKPSRCSTIENPNCATKLIQESCVESTSSQKKLPDELLALELLSSTDLELSASTLKQSSPSLSPQPVVKSSTMQTKFDFLLQSPQKPPERPPRLPYCVQEIDKSQLSMEFNTSITDSENLLSSVSSDRITTCSPVTSTNAITERQKPPRPQPPPIPYNKPKLNLDENTDL